MGAEEDQDGMESEKGSLTDYSRMYLTGSSVCPYTLTI